MKRLAPAENHAEKRRAPAENHAESPQMHTCSLQQMPKCGCCERLGNDDIERVTTNDICDSCQLPLCLQCLCETDLVLFGESDYQLCCQSCIEIMQHNAIVKAEEESAESHSTFNYEFSSAVCRGSCDDDGDSSDHDSEIGSANTIHQAVVVGNNDNDHRFKFKLAAIALVTRR